MSASCGALPGNKSLQYALAPSNDRPASVIVPVSDGEPSMVDAPSSLAPSFPFDASTVLVDVAGSSPTHPAIINAPPTNVTATMTTARHVRERILLMLRERAGLRQG
jgi:hypothetical protein